MHCISFIFCSGRLCYAHFTELCWREDCALSCLWHVWLSMIHLTKSGWMGLYAKYHDVHTSYTRFINSINMSTMPRFVANFNLVYVYTIFWWVTFSYSFASYIDDHNSVTNACRKWFNGKSEKLSWYCLTNMKKEKKVSYHASFSIISELNYWYMWKHIYGYSDRVNTWYVGPLIMRVRHGSVIRRAIGAWEPYMKNVHLLCLWHARLTQLMHVHWSRPIGEEDIWIIIFYWLLFFFFFYFIFLNIFLIIWTSENYIFYTALLSFYGKNIWMMVFSGLFWCFFNFICRIIYELSR